MSLHSEQWQAETTYLQSLPYIKQIVSQNFLGQEMPEICIVPLKFYAGFFKFVLLSVAGCFQARDLCRCDSKRYACGNQFSVN